MNPDAKVPNQGPLADPGAVRLAVIGESGGVEEASWRHCLSQGHGYAGEHWQNRQLVTRDRCPLCGSQRWAERPTPFVGESGRLLDALLKESGLPRERCFVGNVSQRPLHDGEKSLDHCQSGIVHLSMELEDYKPTLVLCLGGLSLSAFHPQGAAAKPSNWRGSLFQGKLEGVPYRCMAAMHPAAILREPSQTCLLRFDVKRAVQEATSPSPPIRRVICKPTNLDDALNWLRIIRELREPVGYDIEGDHKCITVASFATHLEHAISIPLRAMDYSRLWSTADENHIVRAIGDVLEDSAVPKVCHHAGFEQFVHRWLYGHKCRSLECSMIAWNVMLPELLKDLSVVASVLTLQSYWGTPDDWRNQADRDTYNAIDSCVCLEAWQRLMAEFTPAQRAYYTTQRDLLEPCGEMSFAGMAFDYAARDALVSRISNDVYAAQGALDTLAGIQRPTFADVRDVVAMKIRHAKCVDWPDLLTYAKPSMRENL